MARGSYSSYSSSSGESNLVLAAERRRTDITFLIILLVVIALFFVLLGFMIYKGDIHRSLRGYDNCGNVCGRKNKKVKDVECSGKDMRNKKLLLLHDSASGLFYWGLDAHKTRRECVSNCDVYDGFTRNYWQCERKYKKQITTTTTEKYKNNDTISIPLNEKLVSTTVNKTALNISVTSDVNATTVETDVNTTTEESDINAITVGSDVTTTTVGSDITTTIAGSDVTTTILGSDVTTTTQGSVDTTKQTVKKREVTTNTETSTDKETELENKDRDKTTTDKETEQENKDKDKTTTNKEIEQKYEDGDENELNMEEIEKIENEIEAQINKDGNKNKLNNDEIDELNKFIHEQEIYERTKDENERELNIEEIEEQNKEIQAQIKKEEEDKKKKAVADDTFWKNGINDIAKCAYDYIYLALIAVVLALLVLVTFRFCIKYFVYFILGTFVVLATGAAIFLWVGYFKTKNAGYFTLALFVSIVDIVMIVFIVIFRKRIRLVMVLFNESGKAMGRMPLLIVMPFITCLMMTICCISLVASLLVISSAGSLEKSTIVDSQNKTIVNYYYKTSGLMVWANLHSLFLYYWMVFFIAGVQSMCVAGAVAQWFFTRDKSYLHGPICNSCHIVFKYHLGTIAFGSLIIAIIKMLQLLMEALKQSQRMEGSNRFVEYVVACLDCCLKRLEDILKYITSNVYIETAINGYSFCGSTKRIFHLLISNAMTVTVIVTLGKCILFASKMVVVIITCVIGFFCIQGKKGLSNPAWPLTVVFFISFVIAHIFISLFEEILNAVFICFCEDSEENNGDDSPYYMSRNLMQFICNNKEPKGKGKKRY